MEASRCFSAGSEGPRAGNHEQRAAAPRADDHVQRGFRADRLNELWVVDFTNVPTWAGMAFIAFVADVLSRRQPHPSPGTQRPRVLATPHTARS